MSSGLEKLSMMYWEEALPSRYLYLLKFNAFCVNFAFKMMFIRPTHVDTVTDVSGAFIGSVRVCVCMYVSTITQNRYITSPVQSSFLLAIRILSWILDHFPGLFTVKRA